MTKHPKVLLVIIAEAVLEPLLVADARRLGAQGYTAHDVRGGSPHATREGIWESDRTVEIKFICAAGIADALAAHVMQHYAPHYGVTLFFSAVEVLRPDKY
ncbi:MAG: transcriptional regulator [Burkholderiaceae bacterium]|nr:transcriptional regulator [Burkholderiaceae bacterium]